MDLRVKESVDQLLISNDFGTDQALKIFVEVMEGLKHMHKMNYIHRDIKPGQFILSLAVSKI
jgi:serine/threonine protein kinase